MDKRDKAHGQLVSKVYYIEDLVSSHFGMRGEPEFHYPMFPGLQAIGVGSNKVYIYVKDDATEKLVNKELDLTFEPDERDWITVSVIGDIVPA